MEKAIGRTRKDATIIGAGISGLVTAKCLREDGFDVAVLERTGEVGGLWTFRENEYGCMRFTNLIFSKYNYCFSDFPFPDDVPDYPHNTDMAKHIMEYTKHFKLEECIDFFVNVLAVERKDGEWHVTTCGALKGDRSHVYVSRYLAIASGHHAKPVWAHFKGEETFPGKRIHSVHFKDAISNGFTGKRVLIIGIGNSAVDAAVNCATVGRCKSVYISTRSGCWIIPNYIFGFPMDLYACRAFFLLPWRLANFILETVISIISGNPKRWQLNPKMGVMQSQATVNSTVIHHLQRQDITIVPDILRIEGSKVIFEDDRCAEFDKILYCTGYSIDLPYLAAELRDTVLDSKTNEIKLYKNVFSPTVGKSLAFIGYVQPTSGGVLTMAETQARWFSSICNGRVDLPSASSMEADILREKKIYADRWYKTFRHTIQRDPMVYNDEIASFFGAKPQLWRHPFLAWRLLFSSCGAYQWRLQGPHKWDEAQRWVKKTPLTDMMHWTGLIMVALIATMLLVIIYSSVCSYY